jgi:hypothetical protein
MGSESMRVPRELHEVTMSDRGTEPTDGSDSPVRASAPGGRDEEAAFEALVGTDDLDGDLLDELDPLSDIDDVAFGLDVNPDEVDLTFDPSWQPSVADRGWGEPADRGWGDPAN